MRPNPVLVIACLGLTLFLEGPATRPAAAQGTARSMDLDLSIRGAALGGASNALFWGDELDSWANPALLGSVHGVHYEHARTGLVPGLASDVFLVSDLVKIGGSGMGVVLSGDPDGIGRVKLDYGLSQGVDQNGNPTAPFRSFERVRSFGFGSAR